MKPKGWEKRLVAYLAGTRGRVPSAEWGAQDFVEGALGAITGSPVSLGENPVEAITERFPERLRPMPGDLVILPGNVIGIWQKVGAYALTENGWGVSVGMLPEKAFEV